MIIEENGKNKEEYAEIYQVAHMYYNLNMVQSEIASKLYLSRPKVSRLLTQARELGIVEIKVNPIIERLTPLEEKLTKLFHLRDAVVITNHPDKMELMEDYLTEFAAHYTGKLLKKGGILGVSNSGTINAVLNKLAFSDTAATEIVQLTGAATNSFSMQDTTLILTRLASDHEKLKIHPLSVPLYVNDLYLKEVLLQDSNIHAVFQKMTQCGIVLTNISGLEKDVQRHISWHEQMSPHHIEELTERKAVGSICAQYYDINGIKVTSEWNAKTLAMNIHDFSRIDTRIGIGQGLDKLKAFLGALHGQILNVVITDANTASDLIEMEEKFQKSRRLKNNSNE